MWTPVQAVNPEWLDLINRIDYTESSQWTKWKSNADNHQVVIKTPNYYYKVYNVDFQSGLFLCEIREKLGEIYRSWGLHWEVRTHLRDNGFIQIEQRQVLPVADKTKILYKDLLIDWSKTLLELEAALDLPKVGLQVKSAIKQLAQIKLVRDCVNKYEDYAIAPNGRVVLLDDADWFLALVDKANNWISHDWTYLPIFRNTKEQIFGPIDLFEADILEVTGKTVNQWLIFDSVLNKNGEQFKSELANIHDKMLADNIKCLVGDEDYLLNGQPILNKSIGFDNEHIRQIMVDE